MKKILLSLTLVILITNTAFSQTNQLDSLLFVAVKANNLDKVKELVGKGADVNSTDNDGGSILMWATYKGDLTVVKFLVENKANHLYKKGVIYTNEKNTSYYGNLTGICAGENKLELLKLFIEELKINVDDLEYNPKTKNIDGWNAMQWTAYKGTVETATYLLQRGANQKITDKYANTLLHYACINKKGLEIVKLIVQEGADINAINKNEDTPLYLSKANPQTELFKKKKGAVAFNIKLKVYIPTGHTGVINSVAFSPSGETFISASKD